MNENEFGDKDPKKRPKIIVEDKRVSQTPDEGEKEDAPKTEPEAETKKESAKPSPAREKREEPPEEAPSEEKPPRKDAEQTAEKAAQTIFDLGIEGFIQYNLGVVLQFAYVYMGLVVNPSTGLVAKDLERAKLSVDLFEILVDKIKGKIPPRDREELVRAVKDLKLNFINTASSPPPSGNQGA